MKTDGYSHYQCDVQTCTQQDYALPNTDTADNYSTRRRIDGNGIERTLMLCTEHAQAYSGLVETCEGAYTTFEKTGDIFIHSQAEVDVLNSRIQSLGADLEAMTKNRNHWVTEYNKLSAEFEQYKKDHPDTEGGEE